jgi:hypothetical protein
VLLHTSAASEQDRKAPPRVRKPSPHNDQCPRQFVDDCNNFLNSPGNWAERAARLGWNARALFGCRRNYPLMHLGSAGLIWAIDGGKIIELHREWAVIDRPVNRSQRVFYRRDVDAAEITLPWISRAGE